VDLCFRLRQAGWELYWQPASRIVHLGGQSSRQAAQFMFLQLYRSKYIFFRKQYGEGSARWYKRILTAAAWLRLLGTPLAELAAEPQRSQRRQIAQNYRELLKALPTF
jgi:GT2 family glycosyltransferase